MRSKTVSHLFKRLEVFDENLYDTYVAVFVRTYINFFGVFLLRPIARPTQDDGRPPTMLLSSTFATMKTQAAASLSLGLAAAFIFMAGCVLDVYSAHQRRTTPASTVNTVEAGNITATFTACSFCCTSRILTLVTEMECWGRQLSISVNQ